MNQNGKNLGLNLGKQYYNPNITNNSQNNYNPNITNSSQIN